MLINGCNHTRAMGGTIPMGEALKYYVYLFQTLVAHVCLQSNWTERWQFIRYSWLASHFVGLAVMIRLMARIKQELESYDFANKSKRTYLPTYILSNSKVMKYDTVLSKKITGVFIGSATLDCYLRLKMHFKFVSCLMVDCNY